MRKWLSSLLCSTLLLAPARAWALSTTTGYAAFVNGTPAGTLRFELDSVIPGVSCRYVEAWHSEDGLETTQCALEEDTWVGLESCIEDSSMSIDGIVENIGGQGCAGFDTSNQPTSVFMFLLGERAGGGDVDDGGDMEDVDGELEGLIQYSAASSIPEEFEAFAAPAP